MHNIKAILLLTILAVVSSLGAQAAAPTDIQALERKIEQHLQSAEAAAVYKTLRYEAVRKWGEEYSMITYTIKQQKAAYRQYVSSKIHLEESAFSDSEGGKRLRRLLAKSKAKWGNDYTMVMYTYRRELDALLKLSEL